MEITKEQLKAAFMKWEADNVESPGDILDTSEMTAEELGESRAENLLYHLEQCR